MESPYDSTGVCGDSSSALSQLLRGPARAKGLELYPVTDSGFAAGGLLKATEAVRQSYKGASIGSLVQFDLENVSIDLSRVR